MATTFSSETLNYAQALKAFDTLPAEQRRRIDADLRERSAACARLGFQFEKSERQQSFAELVTAALVDRDLTTPAVNNNAWAFESRSYGQYVSPKGND